MEQSNENELTPTQLDMQLAGGAMGLVVMIGKIATELMTGNCTDNRRGHIEELCAVALEREMLKDMSEAPK